MVKAMYLTLSEICAVKIAPHYTKHNYTHYMRKGVMSIIELGPLLPYSDFVT